MPISLSRIVHGKDQFCLFILKHGISSSLVYPHWSFPLRCEICHFSVEISSGEDLKGGRGKDVFTIFVGLLWNGLSLDAVQAARMKTWFDFDALCFVHSCLCAFTTDDSWNRWETPAATSLYVNDSTDTFHWRVESYRGRQRHQDFLP